MIRKYDGKTLAKVLIYFGLIGEVRTSRFKICCPFHNDVNASMIVDLSDGTFFCFGCRIKGDAYDFVKNVYPELNDIQAALVLEKILQSKEVRALQIRYKKKKQKGKNQALLEAKDYYYGLLTTDWNSPRNKEEADILAYMKQRGFNEKALNVSGCKANCDIAYPVLFPILDNGKFCGWVGRTTNPYVEKKRKYLYNDGFRKRDTLCGTYKENKAVFLCEGYMDYLSLKTRGHLKNVTAILGWHVADEQVQKLKSKGINHVISALDNDEYGEKGTRYLERFFTVTRFVFPEGKKDPGEMSEQEMEIAIEQTKERYKHDIESRG